MKKIRYRNYRAVSTREDTLADVVDSFVTQENESTKILGKLVQLLADKGMLNDEEILDLVGLRRSPYCEAEVIDG